MRIKENFDILHSEYKHIENLQRFVFEIAQQILLPDFLFLFLFCFFSCFVFAFVFGQ